VRRYPELRRAPIREVACSFRFEPLQALSPLLLGVFNARHRDEYPRSSLASPVVDDASRLGVRHGYPPVRAVFESSDGSIALQVQEDRFYVNWRATEDDYPRFSTRHGARSVLQRALDEFADFESFAASEVGEVALTAVELIKVDILNRGDVWADREELASLLPVVDGFVSADQFQIQWQDSSSQPDVTYQVQFGQRHEGESLRLETRSTSSARRDQLEEAFLLLNERINGAFFDLLSETGLERFEAVESA